MIGRRAVDDPALAFAQDHDAVRHRLGAIVQRALGSMNVAMGFESGLCIVILAIILDRISRFLGQGAT